MSIILLILFFIVGVVFGSIFIEVGIRVPKKLPLFKDYKEYFFSKKKLPYFIFEVLSGLLFALSYYIYINFENPFLYIIFAIVFISSLLIIIVTDMKYMLIPNEVLIAFSVILIPFKVLIKFYNNYSINIFDIAYEFIFIFIECAIMFVLIYVVKRIGDLIYKKDSLGGGDLKLMTFITIVLGYKMGIVVLFIASFIAIPFSIFKIYKKNEQTLPFGPFIALVTILMFLSNIDYETLVSLLN